MASRTFSIPRLILVGLLDAPDHTIRLSPGETNLIRKFCDIVNGNPGSVRMALSSLENANLITIERSNGYQSRLLAATLKEESRDRVIGFKREMDGRPPEQPKTPPKRRRSLVIPPASRNGHLHPHLEQYQKPVLEWLRSQGGCWVDCGGGLEQRLATRFNLAEPEVMQLTAHMARHGKVHRRSWGGKLRGLSLPEFAGRVDAVLDA